MKNLSMIHLLERVYNTPVMATPEKLAVVCGVLNARVGLQTIEPSCSVELDDHLMQSATMKMAAVSDQGYVVNERGTAFVPVMGTLCHRSGGMMRPESGMMAYDGIRNMFQAAMADPQVTDVVLDVNSHGGEVHGVFDLADEIFQARGKKPITALINETGASAAYLIASAADTVVMPESGMAGSIGVVARHIDMSKANEQDGVKVTYIHAGAKKVLGNPDEPLSDAAAQELQARVDAAYDRFVQTVARNREMDAQKVRDTEAGVFTGRAAVDAGLIDELIPASMVYAYGGKMVDALHNSKMPALSGQTEQGTAPMFKTVLGLMGIKSRDGESDEQAAARLDSLNAIFPNDPDTAKAEFAAGHTVAEAVQAMRERHADALNAKADELKKANDEKAAAETKLAEANATIASLQDAAKDKETRPVVVVGKDPAAGDDLEAQFKADPKLAEEFGSFKAYEAYMKAAASGRARVLARRQSVTE